mgnify:CR=1 FL=1
MTVAERYERNLGTIGPEGQAKLTKARVAVIGAGGLGGHVVELLARMGVGYLRVIDGDTFAAHNLNRQLLATENNLGQNKAVVAAARVAMVNSAVTVDAVSDMLTADNALQLLNGMDVIVDCLDNFGARMTAGKAARELFVPMVHAAIAGFTGQVTTIYPGDRSLELIYKSSGESDRGIETVLGNPAATPALAASLQVQETVKIITGLGVPLRNRLLYFDTEYNLFDVFDLAPKEEQP